MASHPAELEHPIVAAVYDAYMWPQERMGFRRQRQRMAGQATGRVLEVAAGTGLTFPFYTRAQEVIAIDADPAMLKRARRRAANASCPVRLLRADAESLPFADAEFDTIVIAFGLCTIPHPDNAVREARRVLKPEGHLLFLEHVRSSGRRHARLQDLVAPAWRRLTGGCNPNRPSLETVEREFDIDRVWRKGIIVQGSASAPGSAPSRPGSKEQNDAASYAQHLGSAQSSRALRMGPLVEPAWLEAHLEDTDLRILDVTIQVKLRPFPRMRSGKREWKRAHIPGAVFADLRKLCDPHSPARTFTRPDADWFAAQMGQLGIGDHTRVVVYDARETMWAARVWWMLRVFGFDQAAVLNGGWTAWQLERRPVSSQPSYYPPTTFTPAPRRGLFVGKDEVLRAIDDPTACIVCALGRRQFRGERREYGRRRGHIPGACNVSAWRILDRRTQRYRPLDELRALFGPILDAERIITYCGGGVAAASDAFVLHLLGHPDVAVYDGGFIEWSADKRLPLEIGDARPRPDSAAAGPDDLE